MPLTRFSTDAFAVVTICLVALLILLGLLCIAYSCYLRSRINNQGFAQLNYFSGPWIIRITIILLAIWWGFGEIIRLTLLRRKGRVLYALNLKWQETVCKCYIVSNLGFAEPCLFLTIVFLLRAPLQKMELGILSSKWNRRTACYVFLYCLPVFILQLIVILIGTELIKDASAIWSMSYYFTDMAAASITRAHGDTALCIYPLLSTILLGLFGTVLTAYLFWLGSRIVKLVINKGLQKRVYTLIFSVTVFLPLRVLLLGLSVLSKPEHFVFEALAFLAFLALFCCVGVCTCTLVICPVADSLALWNPQDLEARRTFKDNNSDTISLIANQTQHGESSGSISFRTSAIEEASNREFVELSLFSPSQEDTTPPESPSLLGWPRQSYTQVHGP